MEIQLDNVQKPVRRLRRSLKSLPEDLPVEFVHDLRTYARRLEAIIATLMVDRRKQTRQLLKTIRSVRKAAGAVRDMDVLTCHANTLIRDQGDDSMIRLLEHLHALRVKSARRLLDTVVDQRKDARRGLKHLSRQIEKWFKAENPARPNKATVTEPNKRAAIRLLNELSRWPDFNAGNLHAFRIKVKQLRYVLQLAEGVDAEFVKDLGRAKEQIGEWHDWQELAKIAERSLDAEKDCEALKNLTEIGNMKFTQARAAARGIKARALRGRKRMAESENPRHLASAA
jgi:CHAD domain-containing protein